MRKSAIIAAWSRDVEVIPRQQGPTLQAIAFKDGWSDSEVHSATYYYEHDPGTGAPNASTTSATSEASATSAAASAAPPTYDPNGNLTAYKGWTYTYDAQNRLTGASKGTTIASYYYDGKNRQIARNLNPDQPGAGGVIRFSVWDGWELIEEYADAATRSAAYLQGATGVIKSLTNNIYYYQDKLGSTTHIANASGQLLESFHYDLYGNPAETSAYGVVDLYAGERWVSELGLYDLRNRFMSPKLGRFLQADPIGFKGDASNLYRYCGNDPVDRTDPMGLDDNYANFEDAVPQARGMIKASFSDTRKVSETIKTSNSATGRTVTYVPSKMVAILRAPSGRGYELSKLLAGKLVITDRATGQYHELEGSGLSKAQQGRLAGAIHGHNDLTGIARPGNSIYDKNLYKQNVVMERMDQSDQSVWHRREPANNSKGYQDRDIRDTGMPGSSRSSSSDNSSGPSAAQVDAAHQATGVPSLGAEAVNYVNGRL